MIIIYLFVAFSIVTLGDVMCEMPATARRGLNDAGTHTGGHIFRVLTVLGVNIHLTKTAQHFHASDPTNTCWT